jgi:predicted DCC family thiol-disulfide oxidoreductase YuxK
MPAPPDRPSSEHATVLFDGVCNLCNGAVNFIIDRDPSGYFRFAPLQSDVAERLLAETDAADATLDTIVLVEDGTAYVRSTAALRIARRLSGPWPLFYAFLAVPRPLRDAVYDWVAAHRYRWFGRREQCRVPTPDLKARFLDYEPPAPSSG